MSKYFAFLRAINVGGHTVKMDALCILFEECGCTRVETFIASGNVIFETDSGDTEDLSRNIEAYLLSKLGYGVAVFLRTPEEMAGILHHKAFVDPGSASIYIAFLSRTPDDKAVEKLSSFNTADNQFHIHGREVHWLCRTRFSDSAFSGALLEKTLGMPATIRNSSTLQKMIIKYNGL